MRSNCTLCDILPTGSGADICHCGFSFSIVSPAHRGRPLLAISASHRRSVVDLDLSWTTAASAHKQASCPYGRAANHPPVRPSLRLLDDITLCSIALLSRNISSLLYVNFDGGIQPKRFRKKDLVREKCYSAARRRDCPADGALRYLATSS